MFFSSLPNGKQRPFYSLFTPQHPRIFLSTLNDVLQFVYGLSIVFGGMASCQWRVYLKGNTHPLESQQWSPRTYGQGRLGRWLNPSESVKPQNSSHTGTDDHRPSENRVKHYMIFQFSRLNFQKS